MRDGELDAVPRIWRSTRLGVHLGEIVIQRRSALHLLWAIPLVVLVCLPAAAVAGISWCGISGCSGGGWGIDTSSSDLAVKACVVAAVVMALALALIPWLKPRTIRIFLAVLIGTCWGVLIALVTHGPYPWRNG